MTDRVREISPGEVHEFARDEHLVHFLGTAYPRRLGVMLFAVKLEYSYFPPGTSKNEELQMHLFNWEGMVWAMVSIPRVYMELATLIASETGVRIADGIPHLLGGGEMKAFPLSGENVFTLESARGHEVYRSTPAGIDRLLIQEDEEIRKITES